MKLQVARCAIGEQLVLGLPEGPRHLHPLRAKLRFLGSVAREGSGVLWDRYELECGHVVDRREPDDSPARTRCEQCPRVPVRSARPPRPRARRNALEGARAVLAAIDATASGRKGGAP